MNVFPVGFPIEVSKCFPVHLSTSQRDFAVVFRARRETLVTIRRLTQIGAEFREIFRKVRTHSYREAYFTRKCTSRMRASSPRSPVSGPGNVVGVAVLGDATPRAMRLGDFRRPRIGASAAPLPSEERVHPAAVRAAVDAAKEGEKSCVSCVASRSSFFPVRVLLIYARRSMRRAARGLADEGSCHHRGILFISLR